MSTFNETVALICLSMEENSDWLDREFPGFDLIIVPLRSNNFKLIRRYTILTKKLEKLIKFSSYFYCYLSKKGIPINFFAEKIICAKIVEFSWTVVHLPKEALLGTIHGSSGRTLVLVNEVRRVWKRSEDAVLGRGVRVGQDLTQQGIDGLTLAPNLSKILNDVTCMLTRSWLIGYVECELPFPSTNKST